MNRILLFGLAVLACTWTAEGLSCPMCLDQSHCEPADDCQYGTEYDVCGCCQVCKPGPGDDCGGPWGVFGECGEGLTCKITFKVVPEWHSPGICEREQQPQDLERTKRGFGAGRRVGVSRVQPRVHSHSAYNGIPQHILEKLRAKGFDI